MPRVATLTNTQIKNAKPRDKEYNLPAGQGLQVRVKPNGSKLFLFNYINPNTGKRTNISLGQYPALSLKKAIAERIRCQEYLAEGLDPKAVRMRLRDEKRGAAQMTFSVVYDKWLSIKRERISASYLSRIVNAIDFHILPSLGPTPIGEITIPNTILVLRPIEAEGKLETVSKLCRWLNEIMEHAVAMGVISTNPLLRLKKNFKTPNTKNHPRLKAEQLPEFFKSFEKRAINFETRCLIWWIFYTLARPGEAASAEWSEIDFENATWEIPKEKMKMRRPHKILLSKQAMRILELMKPLSRHRKYIFPARNQANGHINSETGNVAIKRMGYKSKLVLHGVRAIGSTVLHDNGFNSDQIEVSLAHVDKNKIRGIYNEAEYIEKRREMMQWWADYLTECSKHGISTEV